VGVLRAASAPLAHTPTGRRYWGATRKDVLAARLQREVDTSHCGAASTAKKEIMINMGMLDDDAELSRPRSGQYRHLRPQVSLGEPHKCRSCHCMCVISSPRPRGSIASLAIIDEMKMHKSRFFKLHGSTK